MASICFEGVSKVYSDGTCAVDELDLEIREGEFMVFVGPSGCGKTTALRMVAGLEEISGGRVVIGDREVNDVSPKDRDIAMVFQNYALYPHMTVAANLAFGLKLQKVSKGEIDRRVQDAAVALDLQDYLERKPKALSGGQRQRVALGRAIVREPAAFLMDEPLSNLDAALRVQTRGEILKLQKRLGTTTIYVTHDQVEAMTMGDRIAVMRKGVLQQLGTPQELYTRPANTFVASFIGSPAMNLVPAGVIGIERDGILAGFRPEHVELGYPGEGAFGFQAVVELVEYLGDERLAHVRLGERLLTAKLPASQALETGASIAFTVPSPAVLLFDAESGLAIDSTSRV
jgi:ABC-type sugar transport system ATPase subunit